MAAVLSSGKTRGNSSDTGQHFLWPQDLVGRKVEEPVVNSNASDLLNKTLFCYFVTLVYIFAKICHMTTTY